MEQTFWAGVPVAVAQHVILAQEGAKILLRKGPGRMGQRRIVQRTLPMSLKPVPNVTQPAGSIVMVRRPVMTVISVQHTLLVRLG